MRRLFAYTIRDTAIFTAQYNNKHLSTQIDHETRQTTKQRWIEMLAIS